MLNLFVLGIILLSALSALLCRQTIYALLFLMNTFVMSAVFFLRAELFFIGAILVIVYVGAITMLFLYVIMFLDIKRKKKIVFSSHSKVVNLLFLAWILIDWAVAFITSQSFLLKISSNELFLDLHRSAGDVFTVSRILYTHYGSLVLFIGLLLFVVIVVATDIAKSKKS